eukprot:SAG22_NODE_1149_length_5353_cov_1.820898_4_plen_279_part_00
MYGWCPQEDDGQTVALAGVGNMTVFLKLNVYFDFPGHPGPPLHWDNLNGTAPTPGWNLFTVGELLAMGGLALNDTALLKDGAELGLDIPFDCDFDQPAASCQPGAFVLTRIDSPNSTLSHGADYREVSRVAAAAGGAGGDGSDSRLVTKRYGFKLEVTVSGRGRKLDLVAALTTFGAGVALLSVATLVADLALMYGGDWLFDPDTSRAVNGIRAMKKEPAGDGMARDKLLNKLLEREGLLPDPAGAASPDMETLGASGADGGGGGGGGAGGAGTYGSM